LRTPEERVCAGSLCVADLNLSLSSIFNNVYVLKHHIARATKERQGQKVVCWTFAVFQTKSNVTLLSAESEGK